MGTSSRPTLFNSLNDDITELIEAELSAYNSIIVAQDALALANTQTQMNEEVLNDLENQLQSAQEAHAAALEAIEARNDQLTTLVPSRKAVISLQEAQEFLDEESTLASYWVLSDQIIVFVLTKYRFDAFPIKITSTALNTQIKAFNNFAETDSQHPEEAQALYDTLVVPLKPYIKTSHLVIVPHQGLHYVPFAALTNGERYLSEDYVITYLPNVSMLRYLPDIERAPAYNKAVVVGNPAIDPLNQFDSELPPFVKC